MHVRTLPWVVWTLTTLFFAYQFILRLFPGLMMSQIMQQFSIDATSFGFLSAMYYLGYAGMQIPVAILLDRFGPRWVVAVCAMICGCSALIFVYTNNWFLALLGRFLIGASSAAGFLGASKVVSVWFPKNLYTRMIGYTFTFGLLGALYGGKPINYMIDQRDWQAVLQIIAALGCLIAFLVFVMAKRLPYIRMEDSSFSLDKILHVLKNPYLLWLAFANLLMVGALEGFADVWGVTYLIKAYHLSKSDAAGMTSLIFVGMLFGGPLLAFLSERISAYRVISLCGFGIAVLFIFMLFLNTYMNYYSLCAVLFCIGLLCCYQVIVFSVGSTLVPPSLMGMTIAFLNSINMLGGSFFHTTIGLILDLFWQGRFENGCRFYETSNYTYALFLIPVTAIVGALIVQRIAIYCKRQVTH